MAFVPLVPVPPLRQSRRGGTMSRNVLDVPLALRPDPDPRRPAGTDDAKTEKSRARLCGPRAKLLTANWV